MITAEPYQSEGQRWITLTSELGGTMDVTESEYLQFAAHDPSGVPVIHTTPAEFHTDRYWAEHIDPVARAHGIDPPTAIDRDPGDPNQHLLKGRSGEPLLVIRTDRPEGA